jgi:alpha-amylase/alpha-mannosidase (GH57 family)
MAHDDRQPLIIHGHFYQPPRENPWTGQVDPEPSAAPFHDWNERVYQECYRPNAFGRIVDRFQRVSRIGNNYAEMSFNVGPTLLAWLARKHPVTLNRMRDADRASARKRGGHGNAIAQAYNHTILPLSSPRDRKTQIRWGIEDFRFHFGRAPEAMWIPETACNDATLGALIDAGMKFAILAPGQAARIRPIGAEDWIDVEGVRVDPRFPYRYSHRDGSGRSMVLFFYDGALARAIAFEGALASSQGLVDRFTHAGGGPGRLIHAATDGESYGHHYRFGDRCLSYALTTEAPERGFRMTNYGEFLSENPPTMEVEISPGPDGEGTSWSCAHGVRRWRADCGCQSGAKERWDQAWRAPLRSALNLLRDRAAEQFEAAARDFLADPWEVRDAYIAKVVDPTLSGRAFLTPFQRRKLGDAEVTRSLKLLEMQRNAMLMFTSCGWFFADISGIEAVQVMKYAARVLDGLGSLGLEVPEKPFLEVLAEAQSNVRSQGTGADVFRKQSDHCRVSQERLAAHLSFERLVDHQPDTGEEAGHRYQFALARREQEGRMKLATSIVRLESLATGESTSFAAGAVHLGGVDFYSVVRPGVAPEEFAPAVEKVWAKFYSGSLPSFLRSLSEEFGPDEFGLSDVLPDGRSRVFEIVFGDIVKSLKEQYSRLYDDNRRVIEMLRKGGFELPEALKTAAEFALARRFEEEVIRQNGSRDPNAYDGAIAIEAEAEKYGFHLDRTAVKKFFEEKILEDVNAVVARPGLETAGAVTSRVIVAEMLGVAGDLTRVQDALYPMLHADASLELWDLAAVLGFAPR